MSDERSLAPRERGRDLTHGISRAELARLRKGEVEGDLVVALMDQSAGLAAPVAPPEGDLVPNRTGWRVGQGGPAQRIYPRIWRSVMHAAGPLGAFGPTWATLLGFHHSFTAGMVLAVTPFTILLGTIKLSAARKLRRLRRAPRPARVADCASGTTVCLEGVVVPGPTVPTLFRGEPAVLFKSAVGAGEQTQGIDFDLELDGQERVRVAVRDAMLVDRARRSREPPACGPVQVDWTSERGRPRLTSAIFATPTWSRLLRARRRWEASVGPGDRVEICGVLHHEADPESRAPFARQMPTRAVIRAGKLPLLVRRLG